MPAAPTPTPLRFTTYFLAIFALVLASVPARHPELLQAFANGRDLLAGAVRPATGWPFELAAFGLARTIGDASLVPLKALAMGFVAVLLARFRGANGAPATAIVVGLASLAMNHRIPLGPPVASVFFFAILLRRDANAAASERPRRIDWLGLGLVALWANVHDWWMFGVAALLALNLGRRFDRGRSGTAIGGLGMLALPLAGCASPFLLEGAKPPAVLRWLVGGGSDLGLESVAARIHSPFSVAYRALFLETPSALAFYLLLGVGVALFVRSWSWARVLPFAILAGLSSLEARLIPLFATFAPVAIFGTLATRSQETPRRGSLLTDAMGVLVGSAFLLAAWPGWLQPKPYEPRSWRFLPPPDLAAGADAFRAIDAPRSAGAKTLHLTRETFAAFRWHCPNDAGVVDDRAIDALLAPSDRLDDADALLAELRIDRVAVRGGEPLGDLHLARLLSRSDRWLLRSAGGGVAVFARRDSLPPDAVEWDLDRPAYRPTERETAPTNPPLPADESPWRRHLWTVPTVASAARDDARLLLKLVESQGASAPLRHLRTWEATQLAGLVGAANPAAGPWAADAAARGNLFRPALPDNDPFAKVGPMPFERLIFALQRQYAMERGQATPGRVYAAVRGARRAAAESPTDAGAQLALARAYQSLPQHTVEQRWAARLPRIARLRNVQASTAYNRALALNPDLGEAHFELGQLYQGAGCFDLAVSHLKAWRDLERIRLRLGGDRARLDQLEPILERMEKEVARQTAEFEKESGRISVGDRAADAVRRGLGGTARDLLLKSDVSAFGRLGAEIEFDFLLRTGRARDAIEWLEPDVQGTLGAFAFHWTRAQARAALGHYAAAREELAAILQDGGRVPAPERVRRRIGELLGAALLDEQPLRVQLPQWLLHTLRHSDFTGHMLELDSTLSLECEMAVLNGLLAFECGSIADARAEFAAVVALAPRRGAAGQLNAPAIEVAREALQLLDQFAPTPPGNP